VIIVSYAFVTSQYDRKIAYLTHVADFKRGATTILPTRPESLSILSGVFESVDIKSPYLVLDEVHAIKNSSSTRFKAVLELRKFADTCIMLSRTPIDNTWLDLGSYVQLLRGHQIASKRHMQSIFAKEDPQCPGEFNLPDKERFERLEQLLNCFVVRRPETTVPLPPLNRETRNVDLTLAEAKCSNKKFADYEKAISDTERHKKLSDAQSKLLEAAQHYANHVDLVKIMPFIRVTATGETIDSDNAAFMEALEDWKETLAIDNAILDTDNAWYSSKIEDLIDVYNIRRDTDSECSVLIFDENVFFLDIIEVAFANMADPVKCFRFDDRMSKEERSTSLAAFKEARESKVMLTTPACGSEGLKGSDAYAVILCGPLWNKSLEERAIRTAWRPGQTKPVVCVQLQATNSAVESYKAKVRDTKDEHNQRILSAITRADGVEPVIYDLQSLD